MDAATILLYVAGLAESEEVIFCFFLHYVLFCCIIQSRGNPRIRRERRRIERNESLPILRIYVAQADKDEDERQQDWT